MGMGGNREGSDEELWQRVVRGDGEAFGVVFDRHRDRILRHCVQLVGSNNGAEDITAMDSEK
jgi:DNA-directed RNA polymerase specialized sigma24 family protein